MLPTPSVPHLHAFAYAAFPTRSLVDLRLWWVSTSATWGLFLALLNLANYTPKHFMHYLIWVWPRALKIPLPNLVRFLRLTVTYHLMLHSSGHRYKMFDRTPAMFHVCMAFPLFSIRSAQTSDFLPHALLNPQPHFQRCIMYMLYKLTGGSVVRTSTWILLRW